MNISEMNTTLNAALEGMKMYCKCGIRKQSLVRTTSDSHNCKLRQYLTHMAAFDLALDGNKPPWPRITRNLALSVMPNDLLVAQGISAAANTKASIVYKM